ncbi:MAG: acyl-CoA dehydrogenase family protein [Thermodesulfobacteriota bacterium]
MDFELTEEERMLRNMARNFAEKEIIPHRDEWNESRRFPIEIWRKMGGLGLMGLLVPEEYGGSGSTTVGCAVALEELTRADMSIGGPLNAHLFAQLPLLQYGTEEQKQKWLVPLAKGEKLAAFGLTEANAGSDAAGVETRAVLEGNEWVINGTKQFVTNTGTEMSSGVIALVVTGKTADGRKRFSAIMIPKGTPGYTYGKNYKTLGVRGGDHREQIFQDCRVPKDHLIGEEGRGLKQLLGALDVGRIAMAAVSIGLGQACFEVSLEYAKTRVQFGQPISKFQAIQFKLADMATEIEMARLINFKAAWLRDNKMNYAKEASMAKMFASAAAIRASHEGLQIHGGYGVVEDYVISRFFKDSRILAIGEGTNEIQHIVIARLLGC